MAKREWLDLLDAAGLPEMVKLDPRSESKLRQLQAVEVIIGVRYRAPDLGPALHDEDIGKPKTHDRVFLVAGKLVRGFGDGCDDWKQQLRKRMAKQFPGIKP